jgi:hypothetical protein
MKTYTIQQVFFKWLSLREKRQAKKSWNGEAISYDLNIERIKLAAQSKLLSPSVLSQNEKTMLLSIVVNEA